MAASPTDESLTHGLLRLARPKQWTKNVLVFAAPGAAGVLNKSGPLADTLLAFVCFCMAASGTYFLNDARDVEADRRHPKKGARPVACGAVPVPVATGGGAALLAASIGLALTLRAELAVAVAAYVLLTTAYSLVLKHIAVVDLVAVAAGFVLRAIGGAVATDVPISDWFFMVTSFGSLLMVAGKRGAEAAELVQDGIDPAAVRRSLTQYSGLYIAYMRSVATSAMLVAYCLWAFEKAAETDAAVPYYQMSIVPLSIAVLRYALVLDQGLGSAPEEVVLSDRTLQVVGLIWVIVFGLGVYTA